MLSDCRITVDSRGASDFAFSIRQFFPWSFVISYASGNVLINSVSQSLGSSTHVPTVTAAHMWMTLYHRYVDDTFALFGSEDECTSFLDALNSMHSALKFTFEKEENDQLPFLDVLVEKSNEGFLTSVFRKPTFTGQYFRWDSFGPRKRKTNLIETLVHRALMIRSKSKLQHELENISSILRKNGYPESIIQINISKKIALFNRKPKEGPQKCPVYLKLPWIGKISLNFEKQTKIAINRCYQPRIIFTTRKNLPAIHKDVLLSLQQSKVVYQYVCRCDCRYVGRTSQRLRDRINQHIPRCIRNDKRPRKKLPNRECKVTSTPTVYCDSAIGQHLLENKECAKHFNDAQFSILATARSSFHLSVLEATYINPLPPILCRQKEFVYALQISH